jgi:hypothetical protein
MAATKPMISADEAAAMAALCPSSVQQQEQVLVDTLTGLLLEGRYFPLSAQEWAVAQRHEFTFGEQLLINQIQLLMNSLACRKLVATFRVQCSTAAGCCR